MIKDSLLNIKNSIPQDVLLVAVSKTKPIEAIQEAYETGHRNFGENKVQELADKYDQLPKDIKWHMIGHLQRNKVKFIAPFIHLIHGVDTFKLLKEINKQALKNDRIINCLLQFHIAEENTKFGLNLDEAISFISNQEFLELKNISISGVMGMASYTEDKSKIEKEFSSLKVIFEQLKTHINNKNSFKWISMGMSGDYKIAINQGSNMVRIGSTIFGNRQIN
ncbi:MAG: YggS family pyridoxal phosphate-dependent enzyme [Flavobacteriales bacterium]|jgi:PLP dependent protein|nr:YggS family pyridoxal phosphate-dependent enzyme [Flavobacteriales bacterium]